MRSNVLQKKRYHSEKKSKEERGMEQDLLDLFIGVVVVYNTGTEA